MPKFIMMTIAIVLCLGGVSCTHFSHKEITSYPVELGVQVYSPTLFEVLLDGKLVGSNRGLTKNAKCVDFSATRGEHTLQVKANGYNLWERNIHILGNQKKPQVFFADLKALKQ